MEVKNSQYYSKLVDEALKLSHKLRDQFLEKYDNGFCGLALDSKCYRVWGKCHERFERRWSKLETADIAEAVEREAFIKGLNRMKDLNHEMEPYPEDKENYPCICPSCQ